MRSSGNYFWQSVYVNTDGGVGFSVAIDGNTAVTGNTSPSGWFTDSGANHIGSAWPYTYNGSTWVQGTMLDRDGFTNGAYFGSAVAVENGVIAVGAFGNGARTGQVRLFQQSGSSWVTQQTFSHASGESNNRFGLSLSLSGGRLLVGAFCADAGSLIDAGESYIYQVTDPDAVIPVLTITRSGSNAVLTWTPAPGWTLWRSPSSQAGSWTQVTVAVNGTHHYPISSAPRMFFRLQNP